MAQASKFGDVSREASTKIKAKRALRRMTLIGTAAAWSVPSPLQQ
jgi:hypothetical protein